MNYSSKQQRFYIILADRTASFHKGEVGSVPTFSIPHFLASCKRLNENTCDFILFVSVWASSCFAPFLHHQLHLNFFHAVTSLQCFIPHVDHFILKRTRWSHWADELESYQHHHLQHGGYVTSSIVCSTRKHLFLLCVCRILFTLGMNL